MSFFSILAKLGIDGTDFNVGMKQAQSQAQATGNAIKHTFGQIFLEGALVEGIKKTIEYGHEIQVLSERLGITAEAAQVYSLTARQNGLDISDVGTAMSRLAVAQEAAIGGSEKQIMAFKHFGITADDLKNKDLQGLFEQLANRLQNTTVTGREVADAMELMGRGGSKMIPILQDLNRVNAEMKERGLLLSDAEVKRLEEANDQLKTMGQRATVLAAGWLDASIGRLARTAGRVGWNFGLFDIADQALYDKMDAQNQDYDERKKKRLADRLRKESIAADAVAKQEEDARKAHEKNMDEAVKFDEEAAKINEKARLNKLSHEAKHNDLLKQKFDLQAKLNGLAKDDYLTISETGLAMAKINEELALMEKAKQPDADALMQVGMALGLSTRGRAPADSGVMPATHFSAQSMIDSTLDFLLHQGRANMSPTYDEDWRKHLAMIAEHTKGLANRPKSQFGY